MSQHLAQTLPIYGYGTEDYTYHDAVMAPPSVEVHIKDVLAGYIGNPPSFAEILENVEKGSVSHADLVDMFGNNIDRYLDAVIYVQDIPEHRAALNMFRNNVCLTALIDALKDMKLRITGVQILNKAIYDYWMFEPDPKIVPNTYVLGALINKKYVDRLISEVGISERWAVRYAVARFSTLDPATIGVKRLNYEIMSYSQDDYMTTNRIIKIYNCLFDSMTALFEGIMFDVRPEKGLSESENVIFIRITDALMQMMGQMSRAEICKVLKSYSSDYSVIRNNCPVRAKIADIGRMFPNIMECVSLIEEDRFFVP
jgi:hypothetical protein